MLTLGPGLADALATETPVTGVKSTWMFCSSVCWASGRVRPMPCSALGLITICRGTGVLNFSQGAGVQCDLDAYVGERVGA